MRALWSQEQCALELVWRGEGRYTQQGRGEYEDRRIGEWRCLTGKNGRTSIRTETQFFLIPSILLRNSSCFRFSLTPETSLWCSCGNHSCYTLTFRAGSSLPLNLNSFSQERFLLSELNWMCLALLLSLYLLCLAERRETVPCFGSDLGIFSSF